MLLLDVRQVLADSRAHDCPQLEGKDMSHDNDEEGDNSEELDVKLDNAAASLPVERLPGIEEANRAGASKNLGDDLAIESAVEGDNSVLIIGEDRGLDAGKGNMGWENQEDGASN